MPLNVTLVAPVRAVPVITTDVAVTGPLVGVNDVIAGGVTTVNVTASLLVPPVLVTATVPVVAPTGTVTVIVVAEFTVHVNAEVPLNVTLVTLVNPVPVTVTAVPTGPDDGDKPDTVGVAGKITTFDALVATPPVVVTTIGAVTDRKSTRLNSSH